MRSVILIVAVSLCGLLAAGCEPQDRRPGLWLSGELRAPVDDWRFTNDFPEVHLQVATPYLLPHSITIVCAADAEALYVGARDPESKNWPAWVDDNPEVVLKVDGDLFELRAVALSEDQLAPVRAAYEAKYGARPSGPEAPNIRYWQLVAR